MNRVFEDFVVVGLREALGLTEYTFPQEARGRELWLAAGQKVRLKPDISWWQGDRCVFVGDAKYKRTTVLGAQNHDIYQALAYALAAGLPSALLIYAHGEGDPVVYDIPSRGERIKIEVAVLDLRGTPDEILQRVDDLACKVHTHKAKAAAARPCRLRPPATAHLPATARLLANARPLAASHRPASHSPPTASLTPQRR